MATVKVWAECQNCNHREEAEVELNDVKPDDMWSVATEHAMELGSSMLNHGYEMSGEGDEVVPSSGQDEDDDTEDDEDEDEEDDTEKGPADPSKPEEPDLLEGEVKKEPQVQTAPTVA